MIARVMDGDAEVIRNGQPGVIAWGSRRSSRAIPRIRSARASCARAARRRSRSPITPIALDQPKKRSGERGSGQFAEITWDEAIKELTGSSTLSRPRQRSGVARVHLAPAARRAG